jgi:predicted CxxxxCH...CXXCH cytochrome family protein
LDPTGNTATVSPGVGAHQQHLGKSTWHAEIACTECHLVPKLAKYDPSFPTHLNGNADLKFGTLAGTGSFDSASLTCSGIYCHGASLFADVTGSTSQRKPIWNKVDGSQSACGTSCHTLPPGGSHPKSTTCATCHSDVVASFTMGSPPQVAWKNPDLHIDGRVEMTGGTGTGCTSCHGDETTGSSAPPKGTKGETKTTEAAVGAHAQHLAASTWHREGVCRDCHVVPTSTAHSNGKIDLAWAGPSSAGGAKPAFDSVALSCSNAYCHGATLLPAAAGGTVKRTPVWTEVNSTWNACGTTCHTNPPGGSHPNSTDCQTCHSKVISSFKAGTPPIVTWKNASLHVDGKIDATGTACNSCHGGANGNAPPNGVDDETATNTLAVGRHTAHLTASNSHVAFACTTCHVVPPPGDMAHTTGHVSTTSLDTAGHHGDVAFSGAATGMTFNVNATQGAPVTARGTCVGTCHSNGRGGAPAVTAYWAGGAWTPSCTNCHGNPPNTGKHRDHTDYSCTTCHPAANTAAHVNGTRDVLGTVQSLTISRGTACGISCSGTCHGQNHGDCW